MSSGIIGRCQLKGWMTHKLLKDWLVEVWNRNSRTSRVLVREQLMLILGVFNTFTARVNHGQFKYLRFNLPASIVGLKFTLLFCHAHNNFCHETYVISLLIPS
jgi:hypothetical protein